MNEHEEKWETCPPGLMENMAEELRTTRARRQTKRSFATAAVVLILLVGSVALTKQVTDNDSNAPLGGITCRECLEKLVEYREDLLAAAMKARIQAHLEICPSCHHAYQRVSGGNASRPALDSV